MRSVTKMLLYCTGSTEDVGLSELDNAAKEEGVKPFNGVYCKCHYIICRDGTLQVGRPEDTDFHTCKEDRHSIIVCIVGVESDFTEAQIRTLADLMCNLEEDYTGIKCVTAKGIPGYSYPNLDLYAL